MTTPTLQKGEKQALSAVIYEAFMKDMVKNTDTIKMIKMFENFDKKKEKKDIAKAKSIIAYRFSVTLQRESLKNFLEQYAKDHKPNAYDTIKNDTAFFYASLELIEELLDT